MTGPKRVEILEKAAAYRGYSRIDRYRLRHELFAGGMGPEIHRELFERGQAAAVLPYDPRRDEVVLIEQFRVGAHARGDRPWLIEIVAGIIEPGEDPGDVARREAAEEAGCRITDLAPVPDFYTSPGISTEFCHNFIGRTETAGVGGVHGLADEGEDIRVMVEPFEQALAELEAGEIRFSPAAVTLLWLALHREALGRRWT